MRCQEGVVIRAFALLRVGVDERGGQPRQCVQEAVLGSDCRLVGRYGGGVGVGDDFAFGAELVTDPPQPHRADVQDARSGAQDFVDLIDKRWVDGVHQPPVDIPGRLPQHGKEGHRNEQPGNGVGPPLPQREPADAGQHREGGEPVGAGV
jgi:hypothetical protein